MITSSSNQRLKDIRRLRRSKGDWALLEGPHLVAEAHAAGHRFDEILGTPEFLDSPTGGRLCSRMNVTPDPVEPRLLSGLADADSPQGLLAVIHLPRSGVEQLPLTREGSYLYVERLQDPGNLGALARSAEAAGVVGLALSPGSVHPNHPRAIRGSAGSLLRLPVAIGVDPSALASHLASIAPTWIALMPRGGKDLWATDLQGASVVMLGGEGPGLSSEAASLANLQVTIPLEAPVESLNVTVAGALVLFELRRRATR